MPERFNSKTSQATNELITEQVTCLMAGRVTWLVAWPDAAVGTFGATQTASNPTAQRFEAFLAASACIQSTYSYCLFIFPLHP